MSGKKLQKGSEAKEAEKAGAQKRAAEQDASLAYLYGAVEHLQDEVSELRKGFTLIVENSVALEKLYQEVESSQERLKPWWTLAPRVSELLKAELKAKLGEAPEGIDAMEWDQFLKNLSPTLVTRMDSRGFYDKIQQRSARKKGAFTLTLESYDQALVVSRLLKHAVDPKLRSKPPPAEGDYSTAAAALLGVTDEKEQGVQMYTGKSWKEMRSITAKKQKKQQDNAPAQENASTATGGSTGSDTTSSAAHGKGQKKGKAKGKNKVDWRWSSKGKAGK